MKIKVCWSEHIERELKVISPAGYRKQKSFKNEIHGEKSSSCRNFMISNEKKYKKKLDVTSAQLQVEKSSKNLQNSR